MSNSHSRVLILGGGLSGLAAAHRLQESAPGELEVRVLEASPHLGGVIRTDHIDDMLLEMGPDSMITEKPWALDLCRRLGIDQDLIPTQTRFRKTLVVRDGALLPLPEAFQMLAPAKILPFLRSPILSIPGRLRALLDIVIPRGGPPPGGDETLGSFVRRRFGKEMLQRMAQPLVGGIYTADPEKLSLATTLPRFLDLERNHRSVILGLRRQASQPTTQAASGARFNLFQAPRGGMGSLVDRLVEQLPAETIQRQTRATGIRREEDWVVTTTEGEWRADGLIVALPAPRAAEVLDEMDPALAADLASIPYASTAVAGLAY
ncbi:MAG: protoporphyrinogen oxidase, partial [Candidatus Binatia bacterium]|nr:protoporphyrinogen oxidase [Candidatus Binatia bacterium]